MIYIIYSCVFETPVVILLDLTCDCFQWDNLQLLFFSTHRFLNSGHIKHISFFLWLKNNKLNLRIYRIDLRYGWLFQSPATVSPVPPTAIHQLQISSFQYLKNVTFSTILSNTNSWMPWILTLTFIFTLLFNVPTTCPCILGIYGFFIKLFKCLNYTPTHYLSFCWHVIHMLMM